MVSLEQVRALESRVEKAVAYIASLRDEGAELARRLAEAQSFIDDAANELGAAEAATAAAETKAAAAELRIREFESRLADMAERVAVAETKAAELNARAEEYRRDQVKIEEGIMHALQKLDSFEDLVLSQANPVEKASIGSGIAVKSAPDSGGAAKPAEAKGVGVNGAGDIETVENELDIF